MNDAIAGVPKRVSSRKMIVSMAVVAVMIVASAAAAIALSGSAAKTVLEIQSVTVDTEEANVGQLTEWTVVVEIQDQGQQGKGLLFTWDWGDGNYTVYDLKSLGPNSTASDVETHAWSQPGFYEVVISVWDGYGSEQNAFHNVSEATAFTVNPMVVNTPPVAAFEVEPEEGTVDTTFTFDATASYDLEEPPEALEVRWDWESDGVWDTPYLTVKIAVHRFTEVRTHTVTLEVNDSGGMVNQTSRDVTVSPSSTFLPHDPIVIIGDYDFVPENGVIGGVGTLENPYVIAGWEILPAEGSGITVLGTTKYFTIRDTRIVGDIDTCMYGVYLENVDHATLRGLDVSGFSKAVYAKLTQDLTVAECRLTWSSWGLFALRCGSIYVEDNEISHNIVGTGNHDGVMVQETDYAFIAWNTLADNWDGIFMYFVSYGDIFNNTIADNAVGIQALYSRLTVFANSITSEHIGIILFDCPDTYVEANRVIMDPSVSDSEFGIEFMSCANLSVSCNVVDSCINGIGTGPGNDEWPDSENVMVSWNEISNCSWGMTVRDVAGLTVIENAFQSNDIGIYVHSSSSGLQVYHNDFVYNTAQAVEDPMCIGNEWDDGYPSGGNFWSDYHGADEYGGVDQDEPGPDGIGDTPYVLASGSEDDYPLMAPTGEPWNAAPVARFTVDPPAGSVGTAFHFDASSSSDADEPVDALRVRWDWEDDGIWDTALSYDKNAEHAYDAPGTYTVVLEVVDSGGLTGFAFRNASVLESPVPLPHAPIVITSDAGFTAENGVVGGSGSPDDPYIISGWEITSADRNCIDITNTSACFVIHNVDLRSGTFGMHAIYLGDVHGGYIIGSQMSGDGGGLMMEYCSFIGVTECDFAEGVYGVEVYHSGDFELRNCDFADVYQSFDAHSSSRFVVESCRLEAKYMPCWLDFCAQGSFIGNYLECTEDARSGAYLSDSADMTFENNEFVDCSIDITGWRPSNFDTHAISQDNTVNGRPILHYQNSSGVVLDGVDAGEVIIVECQDVTVSNMAFSRGFAGVILAYSSNALVEDNEFTSCWIGTRVQGCSDVVLRGNLVDEVVQQGLGIWSTEGAIVEDNYVSSNGEFGYQDLMPVYQSSDLSIVNNTLTDSWAGMSIFSTSFVDISRNHVSGMTTKGVSVGYSSQLEITDNELADNGVGLRLEGCSEAIVYHNNFLDNEVQANDVDGVDNLWDGSYLDGGNYWSDYSGVDEDGDGIGDIPYMLEEGGQDNYPLMEPYLPGSSNTPPMAYFTVYPPTGPIGTPFDFDASSSEDHEDETDDLEVRWDWEGDGEWDTTWTTVKNETHTYSEAGTYTVTLQVMDSGGLVGQAVRTVLVGDSVLLDERFDSWSALDPGWSFWNCSHDGFSNWFEVADGQLHASNNGVLEYTDYLSYANWTRDIVYDGEYRLSFDIYLPLAYSDKIGWAGQVFWVMLFDQSGSYGLISRFVMDNAWDNPTPNGFVYWDEDGVVQQVCTFDAGWHHVEYILRSDSTTWSVVFDGAVYDGLQYSSPQTGPFDISKLTFINALREEVQSIYVDNVIVAVYDVQKQSWGVTADISPEPAAEWSPLVVVVVLAAFALVMVVDSRIRQRQ